MARPMLLEEQIRHNKSVTVRLFVIVFLILAGLIFVIAYIFLGSILVTGVIAIVVGLLYLGIASSASVPAILAAARARPANPNVREEKLLINAVIEMAIAAGINPPPKVYVQEDDDINAFATGRDPKNSVVCATTGALKKLNYEELQGVIGHEMSHIRNQDIKVTTYAIALIGLIAMLSEIMIRSLFWGGARHGRGSGRGGGPGMLIALAIVIVVAILAPILSRLVYFAISRRREYLADASGVQLTRNPNGLASALHKIAGTQPQPSHGDKTVSSLYLDDPFRKGAVGRTGLFSTHPPIQERIKRLREM